MSQKMQKRASATRPSIAFASALPVHAVGAIPMVSSVHSASSFSPLLTRRSRGVHLSPRNLPNVFPNHFVYVLQMSLPGVASNSLNVLVIGSGGREHSLVHSISKSLYLNKLFAAPGNVGMEGICTCIPSVAADDVDGIVALAGELSASFVVVGPEVPLVLGLVDRLQEKGIPAFGPSKAAAILEGSKVFTKDFLKRHNIPTAWYSSFSDANAAKSFIRERGAPIVVKADGLAAGKGVILAGTVAEAEAAIDSILVDGQFGSAGRQVVVEEFLVGEEVSFFALLDGKTAVPLASAQDHKAAYDGDTGPNTGGMGAYSPAPICDDTLKEQIMSTVVLPTMEGMKAEGREFRGVLYCGMIVDSKTKEAKVLEFNVRFGDPECQVLCKRMKSDMLEVLYRTASGTLEQDDFQLEWDPLSAVIVVLATTGYPGSYKKGSVIRNISDADAIHGVTVYHAGTAKSKDGEFVAAGGRVLGVTATAKDIRDAQRVAYEGIDVIDWPEGFCRRDIGWRAVTREQEQVVQS